MKVHDQVAARLLVDEPAFSISAWNDVLITVVRPASDPSLLDRFGRVLREADLLFPSGFAGLCILEGMPRRLVTTETRERARGLLAAQNEHMHSFALVLEGDELYMRALRASMNLITRALRLNFDFRVETKVADAALWLEQRSDTITADRLGQVVAGLRQRDWDTAANWW